MDDLVRDYLIKITGKQEVDGESNSIEVETTGHYEEKDGIKYIYYKEYVEDQDNESERNTIVKIEEGELVSIIREGEYQSQLMLELERQHQCYYQTPYGDMLIKVYTSVIEESLNKRGGSLRAVYSLDFNGNFGSENEFIIELKKIEESGADVG